MKHQKAYNFAKRVSPLQRNLVSDGYDEALSILSEWLPLELSIYPSGSEALTWIVPQKWECNSASLSTIADDVIFSTSESPLHCLIYSQPFSGTVSREDLFSHLHTQPDVPDAIPFRFSYYQNKWGLCCSHQTLDLLQDPFYKVHIDTTHTPGHLKVASYLHKGQSAREFIFVAHLCHPAQFNDDLSGVLSGLEILEWISSLPSTKYSYRLLIVPETIGSVCWISDHTAELDNCIGGCFLEMTATHEHLALQYSYQADSHIDFVFSEALKDYPSSLEGSFRSIVGNDEKQFNAPGVRKPFVSVSRARPESGSTTRHFIYYHTHKDTPEYANWDNYSLTLEYLKSSILKLEQEPILINNFKGEIFMSRYNLFVDKYHSELGNKNLFDIMYEIDGTKSLSMIARKLQLSNDSVRNVIQPMIDQGLVSTQ